MDQFGPQRRDQVTVDHPGQSHDQRQQQHDTRHENVPKTVERSRCVGKKPCLCRAVSVGQSPHKIVHSLGLGIEDIELRELR